MKNQLGILAALIFGVESIYGASTITRVLSPATYTPGQPVTVTITVTPDPLVKAYALEERPPANWTITNFNNEQGTFGGGLVKWGVFMDANPRTLTYVATPGASENGIRTFSGVASFDGVSQTITGANTINRTGGGGGGVGGASSMSETKFLTFTNAIDDKTPTMNIQYTVEGGADATLTLYTLRGKLVDELPRAANNGTSFHLVWDGKVSGKKVAAGSYFLLLEANGKAVRKNIAVIK